jgi:glycosyltransferase involved in cell wall biosynthesis
MKPSYTHQQLSPNNLSLKPHICHLTSAHPRYDIRIFLKECRSLAKAGYKVSLVVADGKVDEYREEVLICDVGASHGRIDRMFNAAWRVFEKAVTLNADIYHLHDPELIPIGIKLKKLGKKVIFDSHEDVPKQMLYKPYLNKPMLRIIAQGMEYYETWACRQFDAVVAATPFVRDKFLSINPHTIDINNYPVLDELASSVDWTDKRSHVCYIGVIAEIRGIREMVSAMSLVKEGIRLQLAGTFSEHQLRNEVMLHEGWSRVDELGFLNRYEIRKVLRNSVAGIVTFLSSLNHIDAQPNKMFEYMSAGIPVIASNFSLWKEIIEGNDCGLCVDPKNPKDIADAIDSLFNKPARAREMGQNGLLACRDRYNWAVEEQKLLKLYQNLSIS